MQFVPFPMVPFAPDDAARTAGAPLVVARVGQAEALHHTNTGDHKGRLCERVRVSAAKPRLRMT